MSLTGEKYQKILDQLEEILIRFRENKFDDLLKTENHAELEKLNDQLFCIVKNEFNFFLIRFRISAVHSRYDSIHKRKFYGAGENQVKAVNQVDIQIEQGEFVAIVGKSRPLFRIVL